MVVKAKPDGYHAITPYLVVDGAARLIDFLKQEGITAFFTSLTLDTLTPLADTQLGVSSLMDAWLLLTLDASEHERRRHITILKARGMAHSSRIFEFQLSARGLRLLGAEGEPRAIARG